MKAEWLDEAIFLRQHTNNIRTACGQHADSSCNAKRLNSLRREWSRLQFPDDPTLTLNVNSKDNTNTNTKDKTKGKEIAVDMRRHLKRWLVNSDLQGMGGSYEGIIVDVIEEKVRNPFKAKHELNPVIVFLDGWRIVPNIGMRRDLVAHYGPETDTWTGRCIRIFLRPMTRHSPDDEGRQRDEKAVECLDLSESDVSAGAGAGGTGTQKTTGASR